MTAARGGRESGSLVTVTEEAPGTDEGDTAVSVCIESRRGRVLPSLTVGANVGSVVALQANAGLCWQGCKLVGEHFRVSPDLARDWIESSAANAAFLRRYWVGNDLTKQPTERYVIDFFGSSENQAQAQSPALYQHLVNFVLPERRHNKDKGFRERWWLFGRPRPDLRDANRGLSRYLATSEVAKYRSTERFVSWNGPAT